MRKFLFGVSFPKIAVDIFPLNFAELSVASLVYQLPSRGIELLRILKVIYSFEQELITRKIPRDNGGS
jgi:hypothetical protein